MFENLNYLSRGFEFVEANSPEELKMVITSITLPTRIIAIYPYGSKHIAWIQTQAKIVKKKMEKKNAKSS